jgi:hypothetical protein
MHTLFLLYNDVIMIIKLLISYLVPVHFRECCTWVWSCATVKMLKTGLLRNYYWIQWIFPIIRYYVLTSNQWGSSSAAVCTMCTSLYYYQCIHTQIKLRKVPSGPFSHGWSHYHCYYRFYTNTPACMRHILYFLRQPWSLVSTVLYYVL